MELSTTEESVKSRVKNILSKLGASDRTHATTMPSSGESSNYSPQLACLPYSR